MESGSRLPEVGGRKLRRRSAWETETEAQSNAFLRYVRIRLTFLERFIQLLLCDHIVDEKRRKANQCKQQNWLHGVVQAFPQREILSSDIP